MSRIDEELKLAFRREPAPSGFSDRLMARINQQPDPAAHRAERRFWSALVNLFRGSSSRLIAVAATALILLLAGFAGYRVLRQSAEKRSTIAINEIDVNTPPRPADPKTGTNQNEPNRPGEQINTSKFPPLKVAAKPSSGASSKGRRSAAPDTAQRERIGANQAEAQAAKERVLLALHIATSTLVEAQRMVQGDERPSK
ncbi:MAG TPA: hypothetical protein VKM94_20055 [Blastocatellia bacterium]|nr:hypothetical protein [Blastocatellia bacterium]